MAHPTLDELTTRTERELVAFTVDCREELHRALDVAQQAAGALTAAQTEDIARHVAAEFPNAHWLGVGTTRKVHRNADGAPHTACHCFRTHLCAQSVRAHDGTVLGHLNPLNPTHYLLEQLAELLPIEAGNLRLPDRTWMFGPQPFLPDHQSLI